VAEITRDILEILDKVSGREGQYQARCPAHPDKVASLSIRDAGDKVLMKCHAGCDLESVVGAMGLTMSELFDADPRERVHVQTYHYTDEEGRELYQKWRYIPKHFDLRKPDGTPGIQGIRRVLYNLPAVVAAVAAGQTVYVVEGEKDVDSLTALGFVGTTNVEGAGKWRPEYAEAFKGAKVVILPDNDEPGRAHAGTVKASLDGVAGAADIVALPDLPEKGDVTDWIVAGGNRAGLEDLCKRASVPAWLEFKTVLEGRLGWTRQGTGVPGLDERLEGGLYAGSMTILQGKPGIGKTMLATQIALYLSKTCAVACLYADEGMQGAAVRIGQQLGVPRADLMSGGGVEQAAAALAAAPFFRFLDPSRQESTVEYLFQQFDKMAPQGMQRVFLVDSAQVVRSSKVNVKLDRRQAISTLLVELRELALRYKAIVLVVSQVSRGSYKSKNEDERSDPLAAGLESSSIEFMADLILHLDGKPTRENPVVKVICPKNRLSIDGPFTFELAMDFPRARFLEPDQAAIDHDAAIAREIAMRPVLQEIVELIEQDFPDGASLNQITSETGKRKEKVFAALKWGVGNGTLYKDRRAGKGGGSVYKVRVQ
jgi:archaellum biogenesis ATPase FlaH